MKILPTVAAVDEPDFEPALPLVDADFQTPCRERACAEDVPTPTPYMSDGAKSQLDDRGDLALEPDDELMDHDQAHGCGCKLRKVQSPDGDVRAEPSTSNSVKQTLREKAYLHTMRGS